MNRQLYDRLRIAGKDITLDSINKNPAKIISILSGERETNQQVAECLNDYADSLRSKNLILSQADYFRIFFDRQKFVIPIIGLSCYADDVYLIGCFGLLILLTYNFFGVRRENRIVQRIEAEILYLQGAKPESYLHDNSYDDEEKKLIRHNLLEYVFYSCSEFFIFNTGKTKTDFSSKPADGSNDQSRAVNTKTNISGRLVLAVSYYLPIIAMIFALFFEFKSVYDRHSYFSADDIDELKYRYVITAVMLFVNFLQCYWINKLNADNSNIIDKMFQIVKDSRKALGLR